MCILGISISKNFPFIYIGKKQIDSGNRVQVNWAYGNRNNLFIVKGKNNTIKSYGRMQSSNIRVIGNRNTIQIESNCKIFSSTFVVIGNDCSITFQCGATCGKGCWFVVMGERHHISIGRDVMIADDVDMWASDSHAIFDDNSEGEILNPSGDIDIKNHVWIGKKSVVLKHVSIGENAIVGMGSVVTKGVPSGCIVVGNPAHVVKNGVNWDRRHIKV